ncbi:MAG: hypothetical protein WC788_06665 [Candidatus Paceibacterota bacterium]|jgi:hypothetical protein
MKNAKIKMKKYGKLFYLPEGGFFVFKIMYCRDKFACERGPHLQREVGPLVVISGTRFFSKIAVVDIIPQQTYY